MGGYCLLYSRLKYDGIDRFVTLNCKSVAMIFILVAFCRNCKEDVGKHNMTFQSFWLELK